MKFLTSLASKPTGNLTQKKDEGAKKAYDPFVPPFEQGLYICELSDTHRLLFNKFCVCKEHTLVVSKEFER